MSDPAPLIAGVELGGTKAVALIARDRDIIDSVRIPTGLPADTLGPLAARIAAWADAHGPIASLGVASFGPLRLDPRAADHGRVAATPKPGWSGADVLSPFAGLVSGPIGFDTDVAGAAMAETLWGAGRDQGVVVYLTVGTGIGGGLVVDGRPVHGRVHPEMGHLRVRRTPGDAFAGICPFHGDCLEGLASGPAIAARAGGPAESLAADHAVWTLVADELAELAVSLILTLSPDRILIGGGVTGGQPRLFPMIRAAAAEKLGGYVDGLDAGRLESMIAAPQLGDRAGPLGAIALGVSAMRQGQGSRPAR